MLQTDLDHLHKWFVKNYMFLNIDKCQAISFSRQVLPSVLQYNIDYNIIISAKPFVQRLGTECKLNLVGYQNNIISRANKTLRCIIKYSKDFSNISTLKLHYKTLVRALLKCSSI